MTDLFDAIDGPTSDALLSPCGLYRYSLTRRWDDALPRVCWVMLNPSKADAVDDDPTITRCLGFARSWGFGSLAVVNLFAWRSTRPKELRKARDPVGPDNDVHLLRHAKDAALAVVAWGAHETFGRALQVLDMLAVNDVKLFCLELTKNGFPRHPLFCRADLKPVEYRPW